MAATKSSRKTDKRAQKAARDLETYRDIADDVIESDFVPYACLYDPQTILTKDGDVMQTIKITGVGLDAENSLNLRQTIRDAIARHIPDTSYAIWMHTLRRHKPRTPGSAFPDLFSRQIDEVWRAQQPVAAAFVNELYITIVKAGESSSLKDRKTLVQSLRPWRDRELRMETIDAHAQALTGVTHAFLKSFSALGAALLTLVERDGIIYSEQLEFLEKLINLEARPMPVPERDLSHVLTSGEITFGYNAMEVRTEEGHRRFAAILTLKEYKESTLAGIDQFLEIPCELIITQYFSFTDDPAARETYEKQARYLAMSRDKELASWMEIDRLTQNTDHQRVFGEQQTSLFLIGPTIKQLENTIRLVQRSLSRLGMVTVREDLRFEDCYWAQLPGELYFTARKFGVDTAHLAGFASLQSAPMGIANGSPWGPPVTLLTTVQQAPYYFNFHRGTSAHTIILGKPGTGRTSFTHFLLAQTRKLPVAIWYLDSRSRGRAAIEAMGGQYVACGTSGLRLNPLQLPENDGNREFLVLWLCTLIDPSGMSLNASMLSFFTTLIDQVLALPRRERRLSVLLAMLREADPLLARNLEPYCAGGAYGELFDQPEDSFTTGPLVGWDMSRYLDDPKLRIPLTSYLLHRITTSVTGDATLLVLDEAFSLLSTPLFAPRVSSWCDYMASQNVGIIFTSGDIAGSGSYSFARTIAEKAATLFAFPDPEPDAEYAMGFGLTPQEMATLAYIEPHHVWQKRGNEAQVLRLNFEVMNAPTRRTLSGISERNAADNLADLMSGKQAV